MPDAQSIFSSTAVALASTAGAWTDVPVAQVPSAVPVQVVNYKWAFIGAYSNVATAFRIVFGTSASGPWLTADATGLVTDTSNAAGPGLQVRIGGPWVKLQYKCSAITTPTFNVWVDPQ